MGTGKSVNTFPIGSVATAEVIFGRRLNCGSSNFRVWFESFVDGSIESVCLFVFFGAVCFGGENKLVVSLHDAGLQGKFYRVVWVCFCCLFLC